MMKLTLVGATVFAVAMTLSACGGNDDDNGDAADENQAAIESVEESASSEQDVREAFADQLSAQPEQGGDGFTYDAPGASAPCEVIVVLNGPDQIDLYSEDEGQPVLQNPDGTLGVQIETDNTSDLAACAEAADGVMSGL